jgi:hypothetical protein
VTDPFDEATDTDGQETTTGKGVRPRRFGDGVRVRIPPDAQPRIERLAARSYRSEVDQIRYLVMLGLETEERRQSAGDHAAREQLGEIVQSIEQHPHAPGAIRAR